jgi:hypothetical protein
MDPGYDVVQIVRPGPRDRFGDPAEPDAPPRQVEGCSIQPSESTENNDQRATVVTTWRAFLPGGTDLTAGDRIVWNDVTFEVVGDPDAWVVDGDEHHLQASLKRVRG